MRKPKTFYHSIFENKIYTIVFFLIIGILLRWIHPWQYEKLGVLDHISSGLTASEAREDAIKQLIQLQNIYNPHPDLEGDLGYTLKLIHLIEQYDLWKFDEEFLELGGWDGTVPYHFTLSGCR